MSTRPSVLFVSHEGTRTGAPMMLLHFLRWLRDEGSIEPQVALRRGGPLAAEFAEVAPTTILGEAHDWPAPSRPERLFRRLGMQETSFKAQQAHVRRVVAPLRSARAVYLNSSVSLRLLHHLPQAEVAIAHVHELGSSMRWSLRPQDPPLLRDRVTHFVAAADCVAESLVQRYGVAPEAITRLYEFIDTSRVLAPPEQDAAELRRSLGLPPDARVIGGTGWADWRKGIDLFVQLGREVVASGADDVHLVWVGGLPGGFEQEQIEHDVAHAGVEGRLHFTGLQTRPFDWYRMFDVFALTSREDPYPLVGLETALLGVPMVCFEHAGGMEELIRRSTDEGRGESGSVVPYLDVEAMADAAIGLISDDERRAAMGRQAGEIVLRDHDVSVAAPQLLEVVQRVMGGNRS